MFYQIEHLAWLLLFSCFSYGDCLTCLKCDGVIKPTLCETVERCGPHEVCQTEAFVTASGDVKYSIGCVDRYFCVSPVQIGKRDKLPESINIGQGSVERHKKDTKFCSECCYGDLCNAGGCGNKMFDETLGPVCYVCDLQVGSAGCEHIQQCGRDKICMINPKIVTGHTNTYTTSCEHQRDCRSVHLPTGGGSIACSACCNQSLCNSFHTSADICNYQSSAATTSSSTTSSTTTLTSTTLTTSTSTTTTTTSPATTADCSQCAKFHPEIVCSTNTAFVKGCVQHCGWHCP